MSRSSLICLQVEKFAAKEVQLLEAGLEDDLRSFGKGFTVIEQVHLSMSPVGN